MKPSIESHSSYELIPEPTRNRLSSRLGELALDQLDNISCSDLNTVLIAMSEHRSESISPNQIINGNKYHVPSPVSQRDMHRIESVFFDKDPNLEFVELSPVQPFGINTVLAKTNEKRILPTTRGSEVNADPTTALFRVAYPKMLECNADVRIASNSRSVRAQNFGENSKFLQHFKTMSEVTVGRQSSNYGKKEIESIIDHMSYEFECIKELLPNNEIKIEIANLYFTEELASKGLLDVQEGRKTMRNYDGGIDNTVALGDWEECADNLGIQSVRGIMRKLIDVLREKNPELMENMRLDAGRVAGVGYYKHICYKILGTNEAGVIYPLADGGSTEWASSVGHSKQLFTVCSGVGTEMIANNFGEDIHA